MNENKRITAEETSPESRAADCNKSCAAFINYHSPGTNSKIGVKRNRCENGTFTFHFLPIKHLLIPQKLP
ncbi:hypothetical protein L6452_16767 [Arctium lappa]|uniref:Uncharacterized protein n=1 Tax=Arctium lappa TaxID=4217 RepID=A0ACB9C1J3_ARCLA|nr:hypothetical protein L6452_16767 [Arctium lappa]